MKTEKSVSDEWMTIPKLENQFKKELVKLAWTRPDIKVLIKCNLLISKVEGEEIMVYTSSLLELFDFVEWTNKAETYLKQ